jgi:hypothetical protein
MLQENSSGARKQAHKYGLSPVACGTIDAVQAVTRVSYLGAITTVVKVYVRALTAPQ